MGKGINSDSALMRGVRTAIQAAVGFVVGLFLTVWAVPGVSHAVLDYFNTHVLQLALAFGVPSGVVGWVWNILRRDVNNI